VRRSSASGPRSRTMVRMDPTRWQWAIGVAAAVLLAGLTVAVLVADGPLTGEVAYCRQWQRLGQPIPVLADVVRALTGTQANLLIGSVGAVWLIRRHGRRGAWAVVIVLSAMLVVQPVSKVLVDRDRPSVEQVEVRAEHTSRSYPSGHSLSTTAAWGTAALYAVRRGRRGWAVAFVAPIASTGVAGAVQGVHWVSDAIAGTIVGGAAAWLAVGILWVEPD
jgi:membrane-associated phospholipid phosphatase